MPDSTEKPVLAKEHDDAVKAAAGIVPQFGPGSKVNWDNDDNNPNKRKHIGIDPDGTKNAKLL